MTTQQYDKTFAQLTAPGATAVANTGLYSNHTFQVTVATIDTNVIVEVLGSLDNSHWFTATLDNTAVANLALSGNRATITSNGTYELRLSHFKAKFLKLNFVSESGGTAATIDAVYCGGD